MKSGWGSGDSLSGDLTGGEAGGGSVVDLGALVVKGEPAAPVFAFDSNNNNNNNGGQNRPSSAPSSSSFSFQVSSPTSSSTSTTTRPNGGHLAVTTDPSSSSSTSTSSALVAPLFINPHHPTIKKGLGRHIGKSKHACVQFLLSASRLAVSLLDANCTENHLPGG